MNYQEITDLLSRDYVSEAEWVAAESFISEVQSKHWEDYLERRENFDDAIFTQIHSELSDIIRNRGTRNEWVLTRNGEIVPASIVDGRYGQVWAVKASWDYNAEVIEWVNVSVAKTIEKEQAHYAKKGYQIALASFKVRESSKGRFYADRATATLVEN